MTPKKEPLIVFLAAGSSADLGMPLTEAPTNAILTAIQAELNTPENRGYLNTDPASIDLLARYLTGIFNRGQSWNFEHLLYSFEIIESLKSSWQLSTHPKFRTMPGLLTGPNGILLPCFQDNFASTSKRAFYKALHQTFSSASQRVTSHPNWHTINTFWNRLNSEFDLTIFTLNYDTVIEQSLGWGSSEEGFEPVSGEQYHAYTSYRNRPKLNHLHGSINYGCVHEVHGSSTLHANDLIRYESHQEAYESLKIPETKMSDGLVMDIGPFITGFRKEERLICDPYFSYQLNFTNSLIEIPKILIVGYGFGDDHINNLLKRFRNWHGVERRVVFIDFIHQDNWNRWGSWVRDLNKNDFVEMVQRWAYEEQPFYDAEYANPYIPRGSESNNARIYFKGLAGTARDHTDQIIDYLKS